MSYQRRYALVRPLPRSFSAALQQTPTPKSSAVYSVLHKLQQIEPGLRLHRLAEPATLDGGDVLQMGGKIFVGLSKRTNQEAVLQLEALFPGRVVALPVAAGLHLKSVLSALDDQTLLVEDSAAARAMAAPILAALPEAEAIYLPDAAAANVVRVGTTVLIQDGFPDSEPILLRAAAARQLEVAKLDMSELIKADGALTCCSLLLD